MKVCVSMKKIGAVAVVLSIGGLSMAAPVWAAGRASTP